MGLRDWLPAGLVADKFRQFAEQFYIDVAAEEVDIPKEQVEKKCVDLGTKLFQIVQTNPGWRDYGEQIWEDAADVDDISVFADFAKPTCALSHIKVDNKSSISGMLCCPSSSSSSWFVLCAFLQGSMNATTAYITTSPPQALYGC